VSSATDLATTVADLAQVHIADIAGALNKQHSNANSAQSTASTSSDQTAADEEEILMNIAVAESLAHSNADVNADNVSADSEREGEEFKESNEPELASAVDSAARMSVDAPNPVEPVNEWELVGRLSSSPDTVPSAASVPVPAPTATVFAHGFVAPAVERPAVQETSPATAVPEAIQPSSASQPWAPAVSSAQTSSELEEWRAELLLLSNMGFDNVHEVLPLLRKFCSPPVSQRPVGAEPAVDGLQRVVHHLFSN